MPIRSRSLLSLILEPGLALMLCGTVAIAQDGKRDAPGDSTSDRPFRVDAMGGAWMPSLSGDVVFGNSLGAGSNSNVESLFGLDTREPTFATDVGLIIDDRWSVWLDAFDFDTNSNTNASRAFAVYGTPVASGTPIRSDFGLTSVQLRGEYDLFGNILGERGTPRTDQGTPVDLRLAATAGLGLVNVDHRLAVTGGPTAQFDEWMFSGQGGAKFSVIIGPGFGQRGTWDTSFAFLAGAGAGGDADLGTVELRFLIQYSVTDEFNIIFGYRHFDMTIDRDQAPSPYHYDGRLAGLFVGGSVRF